MKLNLCEDHTTLDHKVWVAFKTKIFVQALIFYKVLSFRQKFILMLIEELKTHVI